MKVIFLDIDGVLVTYETIKRRDKSRHFCEKSVSQLNRIIAETSAKIVLSSSWRIGADFKKLNNHFFENGIVSPIIDSTPSILDKNENGIYLAVERSVEIKEWLSKHLEVTNYVVIDDDWDARIEDHFVKTSMDTGLHERAADMAIKILNHQ